MGLRSRPPRTGGGKPQSRQAGLRARTTAVAPASCPAAGRWQRTYATGDVRGAETAYRAAVQVHADFADGWNNLAQVLWEQGKASAATQAIAKAVALAGPRLPQYQELQQTIRAGRRLAPAR
jgi:predicted Zn-dependent protease